MRGWRFGCIAAGLTGWVVACGVDYQTDQAEYDRLHCKRNPDACAPTGGFGGGFGGFGGSGGYGGSGGFGGKDASTGGTGGFGGVTGGTGGLGGVAGGDGGPCSNGDKRCTGNQVEFCLSGTWQPGGTCTDPTPQCEAGVCVTCTSGSLRCLDGTPQQCIGNVWQNSTACSNTTVCQNGQCIAPPSCSGLSSNCGISGSDNCCTNLSAPSGSFYRNNDNTHSATVSKTVIDKYEITVGRFRKFVAAFTGPPADGAGAHPKVPGSGWSSSFNSWLPTSASALTTELKCSGAMWTDAVGGNENKPINCLSWYTAFAFCIWDAGRLPTDLEWNYIAAGGSEQRVYPWGPTTPGNNTSLAVYGCLFTNPGASCGPEDVAPVGSATLGNGKWLHTDLAGNAEEWVLDFYSTTLPTSCTDCANITSASTRILRGGAYNSGASTLLNSFFEGGDPYAKNSAHGARCARTL